MVFGCLMISNGPNLALLMAVAQHAHLLIILITRSAAAGLHTARARREQLRAIDRLCGSCARPSACLALGNCH